MTKLLLLLFLFSCVETGGLSPGERSAFFVPLNFKNGNIRNSGFLLGKIKKIDALISKVVIKFQVGNQIITREASLSSGCEFCEQGEVGVKVKLPNNKDDGAFLKKRRTYLINVEIFDDDNFSLANNSYEITRGGTVKDYNNDGYDDFLLGDFLSSKVTMIFGGANGLTKYGNDIVPNVVDTSGMYFGRDYTYGDFNGDGTTELVIGAENSTYSNIDNITDNGGNTIAMGQAFHFSFNGGVVQEQGAFPTDDHERTPLLYSNFGWESTNIGDINLDGYDDLIVSAFAARVTDPVDRALGAAYLYFGGKNFPSVNSFFQFNPRAREEDAAIQFGHAIGRVGDINGDGVEDFAIGSPRQDNNVVRDGGVVYLYFGSKNPVDLANQYFSREKDAGLGASFGTGDVNGDGYYDLITAAYSDSVGAIDPKRSGAAAFSSVDIRFGGPVGVGVLMDQNIEDPDTELYDSAGPNTGYPANVDHARGDDGTGSGAGSMISVGDFNGDGYDDLCFPAYAKDLIDINGNRTLSVGAVWIYPGSSSGIDVTKRIELRPTDNFTFFGLTSEMNKDINGDGYDDLLITSLDFVNSKTKINVFLGGEGETLDSTSDFELVLDGFYMSGEDHF